LIAAEATRTSRTPTLPRGTVRLMSAKRAMPRRTLLGVTSKSEGTRLNSFTEPSEHDMAWVEEVEIVGDSLDSA
jgi:hypothetical protein